MLLAANPARFMDRESIQQHRPASGLIPLHHEESPIMAALRHVDHTTNGIVAAAPLPASRGLHGLADLLPSTAVSGLPGLPVPRGHHRRGSTGGLVAERAGPALLDHEQLPSLAQDRNIHRRLHTYPQHQHHQHQHPFNAIANNRQRVIGAHGGGGGGGGVFAGAVGPNGEEDFEFLRSILLDTGDGSAHANHTGSRYLPVPTLGHTTAASMAASNLAARAFATTTEAPNVPATASNSAVASFERQTNASREYRLGATSPAGTAAAAFDRSGGGEGGSRGGAERGADYHLTEEEKLEAADDVARCIWLAGDDLRDVLLGRLWEVWSTVMDEMAEEANIDRSAAAAAARAGGGDFSLSSPLPRKRFNEVLVQRLQAVRKAAEDELKASKCDASGGGGSDAAAQGVNPPPRQWRRGAALRVDVLARLDAYQRNRQEERGGGGGGGGVRHRREVVSPGGGDHKQGLQSALLAKRELVKSELHLLGEGSGGSDPARNCTSSAQQTTATAAAARGDGRRSAAAVGGDSPATAGGKRKKAVGGGGTAAADGSAKKRKRSGNGRRCKHEGCSLHPHFGLTRPEYCSKHKLPGMFNVKGRRCVHPECTRTPVYGKSGDPHPTYCAAHKLAGYVDIKNPTCRDPSCSRQPSFGSASDRKATYCASHMLSGMVNVRRMLASVKSASVNAAAAAAPAASVAGGTDPAAGAGARGGARAGTRGWAGGGSRARRR